MSPNTRSLAFLTRQGYLAAIVERWSPFPKPWGKRHDLWGFVDLIAIKDGRALLIQATTGAHGPDRLRKILGHKNYRRVKEGGADIIVHGWRKLKNKGKRQKWECREVIV